MSISKNLLVGGALTLMASLTGCGDSGGDAALFGFEKPPAKPSVFWPTGSGAAAIANVPEDSVVLAKHTVHDAGTRGIASHTMLVPTDFQTDLRVEWRPAMQMGFVNLIGAARGADRREARLHRAESYSWYESNIRGNQPTARPGDNVGGKTWLRPPSSPGAYATEVVLPKARPGATHIKIVKTDEVKSVAAAWRRMFAGMIQQEEQLNAMSRGMGGGTQSKTQISVPRVRVRYEEMGVQYEEEFTFIYFGMYTTMSMDGMQFRGADWMVVDVRSVRAPQGQLDAAHPMLQTILHSVRMTEEWHAMYRSLMEYINKLHRKTQQVTMENLRKRSEILSKNSEEIRSIYQSSYKKQQDSNDRLNHAWTNVMRGVDDYQLPDGTTQSLDSSYAHVYVNGNDQVLFTNDSLYQPNVGSTQTWTQVTPIAPTSSGAGR